MWKQFLNNYFSYSHKERAGIGIIFTIVLILILLPLLYPFFIKQKQYSYTEFENEIVTLNAGKNDSAKNMLKILITNCLMIILFHQKKNMMG